MFFVCERWVGDGDRLLFWPKILLTTIAALLSHLCWVAQPWVTEGPKPSVCSWSQFDILSPTDSNCNSLKPSVYWLYFCFPSTCFRCSSAYLHRCISWLTARSRVNMLQGDEWRPSKLQHCWERPKYWEESWRLEETCCHLNSSERLSVNADVKNSQGVNNNKWVK